MKNSAIVLTLLFGSLVALQAQPVPTWETVHPQPGLPPLSTVAFGEGRFVAGGQGGLFFSEDGGRSWEIGTNEIPFTIKAVLYANDLFVAAGLGNQIFTSDDGRSWNASTIASGDGLLTLTYGGGLFVAAGNNGLIVTSPDAREWAVRESDSTGVLRLAAYGSGRFLIQEGLTPSASFPFLTSTDGTNWTRFNASVPQFYDGFSGLVFADGRFIATARSSDWAMTSTRVVTSEDGTAWTLLSDADAGTADSILMLSRVENKLFYVKGVFLHFAVANVSSNLMNWTRLPLPYSVVEHLSHHFLSGVAYGDSTYVLVGELNGWGSVARGPDLASVERIDTPLGLVPERMTGVASIAETLVATTFKGTMLVSTNGGQNFEPVSLPSGSGKILSVEAAVEKFVAVGEEGTILRSFDGVTWSKRLSNTARHVRDVTYADGSWVAVGDGGLVLTSPDASFFTLGSSGTEIPLRSVTHGNGLFVAVGASGAILRSGNAMDWSVFGTEEALDLYAVAHGNGRFVAAGASGIVHVSTDGVAWASSPIPEAGHLWDVAAANGMFLAVEGSPDRRTAHQSTDGLVWSPVSFIKPLYGTDSSGGALWALGESGYVARAAFPSAESGVKITSALDEGGQFTLTFTPPTRGEYTILSSSSPDAVWEPVATLTDVSERMSWTDPRDLEHARFYKVRAE